MTSKLDDLCINTIRMLAVDAIEGQLRPSGGMPMGAAAMAYVLWGRFLKAQSVEPVWRTATVSFFRPDTARCCCMLSCTCADTTFSTRSSNSASGGAGRRGIPVRPHARRGDDDGAARAGVRHGRRDSDRRGSLAERFNRPGHTIVDHFTYGIVSDGDLMEGVASEAASIAGHLRLGKLIIFTTTTRFRSKGARTSLSPRMSPQVSAYHWHVIHVDGNDLGAVSAALSTAQAEKERPSLIVARTRIAFGSPGKAGNAEAGRRLERKRSGGRREALGWPLEPAFHIPPRRSLNSARRSTRAKKKREAGWKGRMVSYAALAHPDLAREWCPNHGRASAQRVGRTPCRASSPAILRSPRVKPPARF